MLVIDNNGDIVFDLLYQHRKYHKAYIYFKKNDQITISRIRLNSSEILVKWLHELLIIIIQDYLRHD
jgi:hypothetical protein